MGIKLGVLFADLLEKVGKDPNSEEFKSVVGIQTEVSQEAGEALTGLMTADAAKNNLSIKNHFIHSAYSPLDSELHNRMEVFDFSDEQKDAVKAEKSTGKKQKLFLDFANEILKNKEAQSKNKKDDSASETLKKEIETLRANLANKDTEFTNKLQEKDAHHKNYILGTRVESEFSKHPWSENYSPELRGDLSKLALNKYLDSNGAKLVLDEQNNPKIVKADNPELEYFDSSNKKVIFTELAAKIMADNKFLRVSTKDTTTSTPSVAMGSNPQQPNTLSKSNRTLQSALRQSISDQQV